MTATISIYGVNGSVYEIVPEAESVRKQELMKEDYVRLVFSTDKKINIRLGDYITLSDWGTFYITTPQKGTYNKSTGGYDYDIQFDAPHYRWNNKLYKFEPSTNRNEASWSLTDNLKNHMAVFLRNLAHHGWNYTVDQSSYNVDGVDKAVFIQFDNKYILDALSQIAEAFNVEWWITDNIIHLGKAESGTPIDFEVGVNVEEMSAEKTQGQYISRLYAFGSTRNLPPNYRKNDEQILLNGVVQKRVMMPADTPFVDIEEGLSDDEVVEGIVFFDDVYPRTESKIASITEIERAVEDDSEDGNKGGDKEPEMVTFYRFKTEGFKFSKDYILPGETLQMQFTSGKLNGMIFDLAFNPDGVSEKKNAKGENGKKVETDNPDAQVFEIVRNETYGLFLPNETLKPSVGDTFVLLGWDITKVESGLGLVSAAEEEVYKRAVEYALRLKKDPLTYPCTMMSDYMYGLNGSTQDPNYSMVGAFELGQRIQLVSDAYFDGGRRVSRVVGYEYKIDKPYDSPIIYVGESATYSSKKDSEAKLNDAINSINYRDSEYGSAGGAGNVYVIGINDTTTPSDSNVYSSLRSDRQYPRKNRNDTISSLWTFNHGNGARRGIQTSDYNSVGANEDNLFGKGFELVSKVNRDGNVVSRLEVDELFVRIKAFFSKVEIREISYVGGNYAFSSAGSKIYFVDWIDANGNVIDKTKGSISDVYAFRCYLYSDDGTTATINKWAVDDQVLCQTFNIDAGVHENVSNKYYWRRAIGIGKSVIPSKVEEPEFSDDEVPEPTEYQYVDISMGDCAMGSDYPEPEDAIVQFGNWSDEKRQGVIYLMVEGDSSPAIIEYSGVGANGKHFVLPDPTLMLSPKKNIIYGEFHSTVDSTTGGTGEGDTIDDQLRALIDQLNDIKNQADKKFEIWFGAYEPLPTLSRPAEVNYPASEWLTDEQKALHAQDLFYDTYKAPATQRGRAWRWTAASDEKGGVTYYWEDVTDQDTIDALEKVADVASDGLLTGGAEKVRVYLDWEKASEEYTKYTEQAIDYGITTQLTDYRAAFKALAKMLNDDIELITSDTMTEIPTPSWLKDLQSETVIPSPTIYRERWADYYTTLAALMKEIQRLAKELADNAQQTADEAITKINDMADDGKLDPSEKLTVKREFVAAWDEKDRSGGIIDKCHDAEDHPIIAYSVIQAYVDSFTELGTYLNDGSEWLAGKSMQSESYRQTDSNLPKWIQFANMKLSNLINGETWRTRWSDFYSARTAVLTALSEAAQNAANKAQDTADNAQEDADNALGQLSDFGDDDILTPFEKLTTLREWDAANAERQTIVDNAQKAHVGSTGYENAFNSLSWYLDDPSIGTSRTSTFTKAQPAMLTTAGNTAINGEAFKNYWKNYYSARSAILSEMSSSKSNFFIQDTVPAPPYFVGDYWMQPSNDNNMMVCIKERTSGTVGYASDWADLSDLTEKRDPRILIAALVNMVYSYNGGYIRENGTNEYETVTLGSRPSSGRNGDLCYDKQYNEVCQYRDGWESITNETLLTTFKALHDVIGNYTIRIFRTKPTIAAKLYDVVCSPITFTDYNLPADSQYRTVEGGIYIQMYNGKDWEILQESTRSVIQNLSGYVRAVAMKSAGDYATSAGFVTSDSVATLFANVQDADGNKISEAHLSAFVKPDDDGYISGVKIKADQITFEGMTIINGKFTVDNDGNVTMDGLTATNAIFTGTIKASLIYQKFFSLYDGFDINDGDVAFPPNASAENSQIKYTLPHSSTCCGKCIKFVNIHGYKSITRSYGGEPPIVIGSKNSEIDFNRVLFKQIGDDFRSIEFRIKTRASGGSSIFFPPNYLELLASDIGWSIISCKGYTLWGITAGGTEELLYDFDDDSIT